MRFVYRNGGAEYELELRLGRPNVTVGDLAAALRVTVGLRVDGRDVSHETGLSESGLVMGSQVVPAVRPPDPVVRPVAVLRVVGGLEAGLSVPLSPGRMVIGRGDDVGIRVDCPDVSRAHLSVEVAADGGVTVTDLGSGNGTDVNGARLAGTARIGEDDLVSLGGGVLIRVLPADRVGPVQHVNAVREARPGGTLPFNRAPRIAAPPPPPPVRVPSSPRKPGKTPFSVSAMLGPLVLAAAVVMVMKDYSYALIALLTPVMFLGDFIEGRTRGKLSLRRSRRDYAAKFENARDTLAIRRMDEIRDRRESFPDLAEVLFRGQAPGLRLWERRREAGDFLRVSVGVADQVWAPPIESESREPDPDAVALIAELAVLPQVPVVVDVSAGAVIGLEGGRGAVLAAARSMLCQAVVGSGPADLTVAVFADPDRIADWDWTKWLPHGADLRSGTSRFVAVGPDEADTLARSLLATAASRSGPAFGAFSPSEGNGGTDPVILVVVDGATLLEGRPCPLRELLAGSSVPCGGIVVTERLPALCTSILSVRPDGTGHLKRVTTGEEIPGILVTGTPARQARKLALALARFEDPELRVDGAGLPDKISLLPLLELSETSGAAVAERWRSTAGALRVGAVLGVTERDVFSIDLDDDGPHGLIAGTTGSGKSELLRTLIASMAVGTDPEHLTFALVDYKGGGALDECARLPHVVGLVTDLDEQLGERALRCMEAELRHREHALRDVGLGHVREYQRLRDTGRPDLEPMPRLVVVIDEFATLVKALPDFVDSLVSIAQRGRSLGMHLIMATQRPAGSVNDAIKNNVKLRIALRLESASDSDDVIDDPAAAGIGTRQWGRAYYRLSAREVLPVQTALSTSVTPPAMASAPVTLAPFRLGAAADDGAVPGTDGPTDLQRLVEAANQACAIAGMAPPRRPWPDPLPSVAPLRELAPARCGLQTAAAGLPAYALADDPDRQTQYTVGWDPEAGNILMYGAVGAGTSTALAALALASARALSPDRLHIFALDLGAGDLAPLAALPHTGAHIGASERERQIRLIRMLRRELESRKAGRVPTGWLVLVDNLGALTADFDKDITGMSLMDDLARVYADGPAVGIHVAATADRAGAVPSAWAALTQQKLLLRMADPGEYGNFDVPRKAVPGFVPGRAVVAATRQVVQIGFPGDDLAGAVAEAAAHWPGAVRSAPAVHLLPSLVSTADLEVRAQIGAEPWAIPIGLGDRELAPVGLVLHEHEHAMITGPPRSGRSSALVAVAQAVLAAENPPTVVAFAPRRTPLRDLPAPVTVVTDYQVLEETLGAVEGDLLLLVDDAETVDDELSVLDRWLSKAGAGRHLIAAGRADGIRRTYGSWTQRVRDGRCGVLLVPDHDLDGDLLGVVLPRQDRMAPVPGRGYLVANGSVDGVQLAYPG
jgi:S-DNA-T family DNA segregation ATPase FtsK/SpoIIIE